MTALTFSSLARGGSATLQSVAANAVKRAIGSAMPRLDRLGVPEGLAGPRQFLDSGERMLAYCRSQGRPICLALFDVSGWRPASIGFNGVGAGLRAGLARRLVAAAAEPGLAGQTSADEFALLMPGLTRHQARRIIRLELDAFERTIPAGQLPAPQQVWTLEPDERPLEAWLLELRADLADEPNWAPSSVPPQSQQTDSVPEGIEDDRDTGPDTEVEMREWQMPFDEMPSTISAPLGLR